MLSLGDILRITAQQIYQGQRMNNVFFYECVNIPDDVEGQTVYDTLLASFNSRWGLPTRGTQHVDCQHQLYRLENLTQGFDFAELALTANGTVTGDPEPSFVSYAVKLVRGSGITRNGSKRVGGLAEGTVTGNTLTFTSGERTALAELYTQPLEEAGSGDPLAVPVIVGRTLVPASSPPRYELDLAKINPIIGAIITVPTTQNTRKVGRGT